MGKGRQYPFKKRPAWMWTTTGTMAHVREAGTHVGLCGEFVDVYPQGERGAETLVAAQMPCQLCSNEVLRRTEGIMSRG